MGHSSEERREPINGNGYASPIYATSLAEFGTPYYLENCGGWILIRQIPGTNYFDAMGCYPVFACENWGGLALDLAGLKGKLISVSLVTDPFGNYDPAGLTQLFDVCYKFKQHYISDLTLPMGSYIRKKHRKYSRNALKMITVEKTAKPQQYLDDWIRLYQFLINKYHISGIRAFSKESFRTLLSMPDLDLFIARYEDEIVGADIWLVNTGVGYAHLSSISPIGYELGASYALCWHAMEHYSKSLRWLDHGGPAGVTGENDGLALYKRGWANGTLPVYFCGKILDREKYENIVKQGNFLPKGYFPAYRSGEFN